jgi:hypothetical protein
VTLARHDRLRDIDDAVTRAALAPARRAASRSRRRGPVVDGQQDRDRAPAAGLCERLSGEVAAALEAAAGAEAELNALPKGASSAAAARAIIRRLDAAGDRCRIASHHIACAARAAFEIARMEER